MGARMTERLFHYVRHADIPAWEALGWVNTKSLTTGRKQDKKPCHHGVWADCLEWAGEGKPQYPERKE